MHAIPLYNTGDGLLKPPTPSIPSFTSTSSTIYSVFASLFVAVYSEIHSSLRLILTFVLGVLLYESRRGYAL